MVRKLLRHWLGIDTVETRVDNILQAHDVIVNYRKKRLFQGKLETMKIDRSLTNPGTMECTVKFKSKDIANYL